MAISVRNIYHSYGDIIVLRGVSIDFEAGKFSTVLGPNGCGKTTLFNLIGRVLPLKSGTIQIAGKSIAHYAHKELARELSVLTQSIQLPESMTVHDMVMQGRYCYQSFLSRYSKHDLSIVENAMKCMQISDLAHQQVAKLSGGQLQRCRMAMLLAQETDIIMLDEPTSHLDLYHQYALLDMAKSLVQQGKTVVSILHDMTQASLYADTVTVLSQGHVYASGKPGTVITTEMMRDVFAVHTKNISKTKAAVYVPEYLVL